MTDLGKIEEAGRTVRKLQPQSPEKSILSSFGVERAKLALQEASDKKAKGRE